MFRPGLDVQIAFVIMKDGSVNMSSVETTKSSRNSSFDLNARAAIEAAANARALRAAAERMERRVVADHLRLCTGRRGVRREARSPIARRGCSGSLALRGLGAQDTTNAIRLGVRGASSAQPGLAVLAGPGLDSVRTIVQRDLENSNRFTMPPHGADSAFILRGPFNPTALKGIGLTWVVELEPAVGGVDVKLYDMATGTIRQQATRPLDPERRRRHPDDDSSRQRPRVGVDRRHRHRGDADRVQGQGGQGRRDLADRRRRRQPGAHVAARAASR